MIDLPLVEVTDDVAESLVPLLKCQVFDGQRIIEMTNPFIFFPRQKDDFQIYGRMSQADDDAAQEPQFARVRIPVRTLSRGVSVRSQRGANDPAALFEFRIWFVM